MMTSRQSAVTTSAFSESASVSTESVSISILRYLRFPVMMSNGSRAFWSVCSPSYTETPAFSPAMEPEPSETPARMVTDAGFMNA